MSPFARGVLAGVFAGCSPEAATVGAWTSQATYSDTGGGLGSMSSADGSSAVLDGDGSTMGAVTTGSLDDGEPQASTGPGVAPVWVARVVGSPPRLEVLDLVRGDVTEICELADVPAPDALAFLADGRLVGTTASSPELWIADPCACTVTTLESLEPYPALHAVAELEGSTIIGANQIRSTLSQVDMEALLPTVDIDFPRADVVLSMATLESRLYALVDDSEVRLWELDEDSGAVLTSVMVVVPSTTRGLTPSPTGAGLLACGEGGTLWELDPETGAALTLPVAWPTSCSNLAAPSEPIACIDAVLGS